ncbi:hypothetical protein GGD66_002425 [Bradyrhizobium sp. CIR48]|nr:hypothetical protein [Bradyrhizobium sp. CIR48]MBB4423881.1 hypothetical protein [Bradyrhizobium sp. CIR48]
MTVGSKSDVTEPIDGVDRLFLPEGFGDLLQLSDIAVLAIPHVPKLPN